MRANGILQSDRTKEIPNGRYSSSKSRAATRKLLLGVLVFYLPCSLEFLFPKGLLINCNFTKTNEQTILGGSKAIIKEHTSLSHDWRNVAEDIICPLLQNNQDSKQVFIC